MVVTEQVDALRMCAADPIDFLIVPRFKASMVMTPVLVVWAGTVAFLAGAVTATSHSTSRSGRSSACVSLVELGDSSRGS